MAADAADVRISMVLPRDLVAALDIIASTHHRSRAGEIRHALQRHADQHGTADQLPEGGRDDD